MPNGVGRGTQTMNQEHKGQKATIPCPQVNRLFLFLFSRPWPTIVCRCEVPDRLWNTLVKEVFPRQQWLAYPALELHQERVTAHLVSECLQQHWTILRQVFLHGRHRWETSGSLAFRLYVY